MRGRSAGGMPMPASATATSIRPGTRLRPVTVTEPPSGVYFTALSMRLVSTWAAGSGSGETGEGSGGICALPDPRAGGPRGDDVHHRGDHLADLHRGAPQAH